MSWIIDIHDEFEKELNDFSREVKKALFAEIKMLSEFGHQLGRPHADTLAGSKYHNMKELRFDADNGVWRIAFAFDVERKGILLVGGDKRGANQKKFYKELIKKADGRFTNHLEKIKEKKNV